ncbi:hypothetical protein AK830_g10930 [Neonectria ditissima]|uniref:BTB domain-containing protein n=1 Tax=Neonectria ditissima TaxID=78410 RepID=A0A0N8H5A7_9HYPO|nr:hypothetical protein AK830_g10930 [Neonectria ditissima]
MPKASRAKSSIRALLNSPDPPLPRSVETAPSLPPSQTLPSTRIDSHGDLILRVGKNVDDGEHDFSVCSSTMRRASPVWKTMLFGGFKEAKPDKGEWIVSLPEEHAASMHVVLDIIHARFSSVPKTPSLSLIEEIRVIVDKYDMKESLSLWFDDWLKVLKASNMNDGLSLLNGIEMAWDFGDRKYFSSLVTKLVVKCSVDEDGSLYTEPDYLLEDPISSSSMDVLSMYIDPLTSLLLIKTNRSFCRDYTRPPFWPHSRHTGFIPQYDGSSIGRQNRLQLSLEKMQLIGLGKHLARDGEEQRLLSATFSKGNNGER